MKQEKWIDKQIGCNLILFLILGILNFYIHNTGRGLFLSVPILIVFFLMVILWEVSAIFRVVDLFHKRVIRIETSLMLILLMLQILRFEFGNVSLRMTLSLWYAIYLPLVMCPTILVLCAIRDGRGQRQSSPWYSGCILAVSVLLVFLIFANGHHQQMFYIYEVLPNYEVQYTQGPLFFATAIWMFSLFVATLIILLFQCRDSKSRKGLWAVIVLFGICGAYLVGYPFREDLIVAKPYYFQQVFCLLVVCMLEGALRMGVIASNSGYQYFFQIATVNAQVVSEDGKDFCLSRNAVPLSKEMIRASIACDDPEGYEIDPDTRLRHYKVQSGDVFYLENYSVVNEISEHLEEVKEQLEEYNKVLDGETELKRKQVTLIEQNRLYDHVAVEILPQLEKIEELISREDFDKGSEKEGYRTMCVLLAYVKRKANLILIGEKRERLEGYELEGCIHESMDYLKVYGITCGYECSACGTIRRENAVDAYDCFEQVVEQSLASETAIYVYLMVAEGMITLRMVVEPFGRELLEGVRGLGVSSKVEDGILYVTFERREDVEHE